MAEFALIRDYFSTLGSPRDDVILGVGDDGALVRPRPGQELVLVLDTLVAGVHFPGSASPADIGHKALAVNLSDLAAMGAEPAWATLGLTLPKPDRDWVRAFAQGFDALARQHGVQLVGGDTTRGPLSVTVQVAGHVPPGQALRRDGARPGDAIFVTGPLGGAGLGLKLALGELTLPRALAREPLRRLHRPEPRLREGQALRGLASAAIDISDGLLADLGHLLAASGVGARVRLEALPLDESVRACLAELGGWQAPLSAGDDYELCFTVPPEQVAACERLLTEWACGGARIGSVERESGLRCEDARGRVHPMQQGGYEHFA